MQGKIKSLLEIQEILEKERDSGLKIVQCHGVFDLLHPGHIRHLKEAKSRGDRLVVSVTPDRFVNKGPGRPAFDEFLRVETLSSLSFVDYVVLNDTPDAVSIIRKIRPSVYVKGKEYSDHSLDVTGKITDEVQAVKDCGGTVFYTDDIVFSSSSLINRHIDPNYTAVSEFLEKIRQRHSNEEIMGMIDSLSSLKVLVIGDAIIDEYQYVDPLGQSGKGIHMVARCMDKEVFLGGSLIVANHIASFSPHVTLLTAIGEKCPHEEFIHQSLDPQVKKEFLFIEGKETLTKKRYVLKEGKTLSKLFETYSGSDLHLNSKQSESVVHYLQNNADAFDLILVADFGNGFTNPALISAISDLPGIIAINTQTNSGNRGFHVITKYKRADFISINEPELRLAAHDRNSSLEDLSRLIFQKMHCSALSVTRGVNGMVCFGKGGVVEKIPALTTHIIDRIGAGDSYFALSSLCLAKGFSPLVAAFIGSLAAAIDIQIIGNKEAVKKAALCKFLTRLMK